MNGLTSGFGFFHSPFDKLRANGKIPNLMAVSMDAGIQSQGERSEGFEKYHPW